MPLVGLASGNLKCQNKVFYILDGIPFILFAAFEKLNFPLPVISLGCAKSFSSIQLNRPSLMIIELHSYSTFT